MTVNTNKLTVAEQAEFKEILVISNLEITYFLFLSDRHVRIF